MNYFAYLLGAVESGGSAQGIVAILFVILMMGVGLLAVVFWIWMLIDCIKNEPAEGNDKIIWVLVIVLLQGLGAIIYYFARRGDRIQQYGK